MTVNSVPAEPAPIVTGLVTVAASVLFDVSVTAAPPAGAVVVSVTVPVRGLPPIMESAETFTLASAAAAGGGLSGLVLLPPHCAKTAPHSARSIAAANRILTP